MEKEFLEKIKDSSCCIIAGGLSSRMGYPKGLLPLGAGTIMDHLIQAARGFDDVFISANMNEYETYGLPVIRDIYRNIGPLSAIYSALTAARNPWVLLLPCDMPLVNEDVMNVLFRQNLSPAQAVIVSDGEKPYPVLDLYHQSILPNVLGQISNGNYRLRDLLATINTQYVTIDDKKLLSDINTREDYEQLLKTLP